MQDQMWSMMEYLQNEREQIAEENETEVQKRAKALLQKAGEKTVPHRMYLTQAAETLLKLPDEELQTPFLMENELRELVEELKSMSTLEQLMWIMKYPMPTEEENRYLEQDEKFLDQYTKRILKERAAMEKTMLKAKTLKELQRIINENLIEQAQRTEEMDEADEDYINSLMMYD
ncbi:MAG: hypothetical protein ACI4DP_11285 [Candidatus Ornithomonoglobus sp.]